MCRRKRGSETGPSPVDRARNGSKHHLLVDATGIPLAWTVTGGNRHDSTQLIPLVDRVPPVRGKVGRPRRRPNASAPTAAPTTTAIVASSVGAGSHRRSRGASPATARGSAATAGSLSAPSPGCTSSTRRFSRSAAASSATADSGAPHCETSSKPVVGSFGGASTSGASCSATATLRPRRDLRRGSSRMRWDQADLTDDDCAGSKIAPRQTLPASKPPPPKVRWRMR